MVVLGAFLGYFGFFPADLMV